MPHPILICGLVIGGAIAGWRIMRERGRIRRMFDKLSRDSVQSSAEVIPLVHDPDTGIYGPARKP